MNGTDSRTPAEAKSLSVIGLIADSIAVVGVIAQFNATSLIVAALTALGFSFVIYRGAISMPPNLSEVLIGSLVVVIAVGVAGFQIGRNFPVPSTASPQQSPSSSSPVNPTIPGSSAPSLPALPPTSTAPPLSTDTVSPTPQLVKSGTFSGTASDAYDFENASKVRLGEDDITGSYAPAGTDIFLGNSGRINAIQQSNVTIAPLGGDSAVVCAATADRGSGSSDIKIGGESSGKPPPYRQGSYFCLTTDQGNLVVMQLSTPVMDEYLERAISFKYSLYRR